MRWFKMDSDTPHHRVSKRVMKHLGVHGFGSMILLWCYAAAYGRDITSPGRCVDTDLEPIPKEDLIDASGLTEEGFDQLMAILFETKTIDMAAWTDRGELAFPGMSKRADEYSQTLARGRRAASPPTKATPTPRPAKPAALALSREEALPAAPQGRFEAFWALYPKRIDKQRTQALWNSKGLNVEANPQLAEVIMVALRRHVAAWETEQRELRYIASPYQYLKHRRWEDEAPPPPPPVRTKRTRAMQEAAAAFLASAPEVTPSDAEGA
jgi:hypothetical protein